MKTPRDTTTNDHRADSRDECRECAVLLGAFVDGVLDAANTLEVDEHLAHCETCRERVELDTAVRSSLKKAMSQVTADDGVRARVRAAMLAAKNGEPIVSLSADNGQDGKAEKPADAPVQLGPKRAQKELAKLASWRTLVPLASAAALALLWNGVAQTSPQTGHQTDVMRAGFGHDPLEDLVAQHSQKLPPERTDPKDLRGFEGYVGVPVHALHFRAQQNARLVGGRLTTVHHERAAMLQYEVGQGSNTQRVTVFVYDPHKIQVGRGESLTPRAMGTSEVRVGRTDGYSVAVRGGVDAGVGYTVISDDPERSVELAMFTDDD